MTKPKQVVIESSSRCNLSCRGCYRQLKKMDYPEADMDLGLFNDILYQVKDWKPIIIPFSDGEPLLNPDFENMLRNIVSRGMHYNFATNGTIWNEDVIDFARQTADSICFSLDGHPGSISYYRGISIKRVHKMLHNIRISRCTEDRKANIAVSLTRQGQDWEEIESFIWYWLMLPNTGFGIDYVIIRNHLDSKPYQGRPNSYHKCKYLNPNPHYLVIRSDGKVRLCERNMNAPIVGDLTKEPINAVLPKLTEHEVCKTCGQRYCGSGMFGEIRFKSRPNGQPIYFKQDYFNQIYSLKEVKEGISWT